MKGKGEGEKGGGGLGGYLFIFFCVPFFFFLAVESRIDYGWTLLWLT